MRTTVHQAADADRVADREAGHLCADGAHVPHDLVAGNAGIEGAGPLRAYGVQVGMTDAAVRDVDLDVVRAGSAALDVERFEWLVGGMGALGSDGHGVPAVRAVAFDAGQTLRRAGLFLESVVAPGTRAVNRR